MIFETLISSLPVINKLLDFYKLYFIGGGKSHEKIKYPL